MLNEMTNAKQITAPARLVRGVEEGFVAQLLPVIKQEDVALDLGGIERIDAGGITALLALRAEAAAAGRVLSITRTSARAEEILRLVGLGTQFSSREAKNGSQCETEMIRSAA